MKPRFDLGIRCGQFLSMKDGKSDSCRDYFVGVQGDQITEVSAWNPSFAAGAAQFIDASDKLVMPGLVNAHTHLPMSLFRGLEDDAPLHQWLFERIFPLEKMLVDADFVRVGTLLSAMECIRFGVTTVNDMYYYAANTARALDQAGLRGYVGQTFLSGETPEDKDLGSDKEALFEGLHSEFQGHPRIRISLTPHAPYTCDDATFRKVVRLSERLDARIHTHLSETAFEVEQSLKTHGKTPVQRLSDLGVLGRRTLAAHCVHLDEADTDILKKSGTSVAYNPDSNLKLSSGIAPIVRYRRNGIAVAFGTDGAASNNDLSLFGAMDLGTKLQKLASGDNTAMGAADALRMATWEGAQALGLGDQVGSIEKGKKADLILIDLDHLHLKPAYNPGSLLVYATQGLEVDTVICAGRVLMENREILSLDRDRILQEVESKRVQVEEAVAKL